MIVDTDILEAVLTQWEELAMQQLGAVLPSTRVYTGKLPAGPAMPYAQIMLEKLRPDDIESAFGYNKNRIVWRKMIVKVWGETRASVEQIAEYVLECYCHESVLTMTENTMAAIIPSEPVVVEDDAVSQEANPTWRADCEFELMVNAQSINEPN